MKGVDVAGGLLVLAVGTVAYLLAVAVMDHWVIAGGLGFWGRPVVCCCCWAPAAPISPSACCPRLLHRINPVFAAQTIEQSGSDAEEQPDQFPPRCASSPRGGAGRRIAPGESRRRRPDHGARGYDRRSGADRAAGLRADGLADPGSPSTSSFRRRTRWFPWAGSSGPGPTSRATRVTINDVRPGDAVAFHGDMLDVRPTCAACARASR